MPTNSNKVEHAVATMNDATETPQQMIAAGDIHISKIKSKAAAGSEVEGAVGLWDTAHKDLIKANQDVTDADVAARAARTARAVVVKRWKGRARGCLNAITVEAAGSEEAIKAYVLDVAERMESPLETVPENLIGVKNLTTGLALWEWKTHKGNHGYAFQTATDPNVASTYSAQAHCTKGKYELPDQTPGTVLYGRVAAVDSRLPGRQTAWSAWVPVHISP